MNSSARLCYVRRDLGYIDSFMHDGYAPVEKYTDNIITIHRLYDQQKQMYDNKTHKIDDRIVSISQPYVRSIVCGKAKQRTEFGAKLHLSIDENSFGRIEYISFKAYNEGSMLIDALNAYKYRNGCYPERALVNQIYHTRENMGFCKQNGIRMSGPRLGRPVIDASEAQKQSRITAKDNSDRIEVERYFSVAKRRNGMGLVNKKREDTSLSTVAMSVLVTSVFGSFKRAVEAGAEKVDMSNISNYDQGCNEEFQGTMKNYFDGNTSYDDALAQFKSAITEKYPELTMK